MGSIKVKMTYKVNCSFLSAKNDYAAFKTKLMILDKSYAKI